MADANNDIKNKLGNEYDLYSSLKDKFQGFDKDGNAVFKDEAGDVTSFNKTDFSKMNEQLKSDFGEKSYEDTFNQNQYEDLAKQGNKFQGFAGENAIFRNEKGDLENFGSQGGFASFLKKQQPNSAFDITKQGQSQRTNSNYVAGADFLAKKDIVKQKTGSGFTGYNPQAALMSLGGKMMSPEPEIKSSLNPNILKANNPGGTFQTFKAKQPAPPKKQQTYTNQSQEDYTPPPPPSLGDVLKQAALQKANSEFNNLKAQGANLLEQKKDEAQGAANNVISNATGISTQMLTNPEAVAKQLAINKAAESTGLNPNYANLLQGNISQNVQNLAEDKAKAAGMDFLKQNDPTGLSQYANLIDGNIVDNAKAAALANAKTMGLDFLKENDPTGGALAGLGEYAGLLKGDVTDNVKELAVKKAQQAALQQGLTAAGLDPTGGLASGALNVGKSLLSGGSGADKGDAAARAAAKAAAAYLSGGVVSPESLALAETVQNKQVDLLNKNIGKDAQTYAKPVTQMLTGGTQVASKALNEGLDVAGALGSGYGRNLEQAGKGLKAITQGNIEEGLKGLGSGAANAAIQTFLKNPETIAKGIGNLGKAAAQKAADAAKAAAAAVSNVLNALNPFCFSPDTPILMADGKYKKIKTLKLGDEVMLGGKITAIGQGYSDDMWLYDGVEVSGGHALYEDGVWTRVAKSKYGVKIAHKDEVIVYPMSTENHLIVTKGQIWADLDEVSNTYEKKDTDIIAELNSQKNANQMLDIFLKNYFRKK